MKRSLPERAANCALRLARSGTSWWPRVVDQLRGTVTVLLYHRVCGRSDTPWLEMGGVPYTNPDSFRRQLSDLKACDAQFLTFSQIRNGAWPDKNRPGFVISFDDGFADNFTCAVPILNQLRINAVFFVVGAIPGRTSLLWEHAMFRLAVEPDRLVDMNALVSEVMGRNLPMAKTLYALRSLLAPSETDGIIEMVAERLPDVHNAASDLYPDWNMLKKAQANGHQIAAHTTTHRMRHTLTRNAFENEIVMAKQLLEKGIGNEVEAMSYPYNSYFLSDDEICSAAGYKQVATVDHGRLTRAASPFWVPRRTVFRIHDRLSRFRELIARTGY